VPPPARTWPWPPLCTWASRTGTESPEKLEGCGYDPARAVSRPMRLAEALGALRFERYLTDWEYREYACPL
jgi:hypothetical protein